MAVGGVGGFLGQLINPGLDDRIATHLTPNPNPLAQQGVVSQDPKAVDALGNPVPQQPPQPGANLAPGAYTQPDPVNNSYIKDLLTRQRIDANAATFNEGLDQMAASFGTAQQQASKQAARAHGGGVGGSLADLSAMQAMQDATIKDNEHARFMANAAVFGQMLRGQGINVTDAQATEIMNNPELLQQMGGAGAANATQTGDVKGFNAARASLAADLKAQHPDWTPGKIQAEVANQIPSGILAMGAGANAEDQAYYQYAAQTRAAGGVPDDIVTWKGKHQAATDALVVQQRDAQKFKDDATADYTPLHTKLSTIQPYIDTLINDPGAAKQALATMLPTTGRGATWMPGVLVPDNVKAAGNALDKIRNSLTADALAGTKNVRNVREFDTLGAAAFGGLQPGASDADFKRALADLKNKFLDAQATNELANGHKLTGDLIGHGQSDLLEPTINGKANPYYNGATEDATRLVGKELDDVKQALIDHPERREEILNQVRKNGYSPRGLY